MDVVFLCLPSERSLPFLTDISQMTQQTVANALKHTLPVVTYIVIVPGFSATPVQWAICFQFMYLGEVMLAWSRGRRRVDRGWGDACMA